MKEAGIILCLLVASASWVAAGEQPSFTRGQELFTSSKLGTSGKSCADCHPGGKKLGKAAGYKEEELAEIINQCIQRPLNGKPLPADSVGMKSLIIYLRTFGPPKQP